jgi:hypothetical protein
MIVKPMAISTMYSLDTFQVEDTNKRADLVFSLLKERIN